MTKSAMRGKFIAQKKKKECQINNLSSPLNTPGGKKIKTNPKQTKIRK